MYTFNLYVFGHDFSVNKKLNNDLDSSGFEISKEINHKLFEVSTPYHGGKIAGDTQSLVFGTIITDDDHNELYIDEVRHAKEEDYINDYIKFIDFFIEAIKEDGDDGDGKFINEIIDFLRSNKPKFYTVEVSS